MIAAIGPGIGGCCYEVGSDVAKEFASQFPEAREWFDGPFDALAAGENDPNWLPWLTMRPPGHPPPPPTRAIGFDRRQPRDPGECGRPGRADFRVWLLHRVPDRSLFQLPPGGHDGAHDGGHRHSLTAAGCLLRVRDAATSGEPTGGLARPGGRLTRCSASWPQAAITSCPRESRTKTGTPFPRRFSETLPRARHSVFRTEGRRDSTESDSLSRANSKAASRRAARLRANR